MSTSSRADAGARPIFASRSPVRGGRILAPLVLPLLLLCSRSALANTGGVAGYTGKPTTFAPQGESCNQCHTGGAAPQVRLEGPATMQAGQEAEFTFVVETGAARAAGSIAATDGVVLAPGTGLRDSFGEMVQNAPLTPAGGSATFRFRLKAPATNGTLMLWAVGLAANASGGSAGDRGAHTTRTVTVVGGTTPPPPAPGGDGGTSGSSGTSGGTTGDGGATVDEDGNVVPGGGGAIGEDESEEDGRNGASSGSSRRSLDGPAASCTVRGAESDGLGLADLAGVVIVGALVIRRRRRRRRVSSPT